MDTDLMHASLRRLATDPAFWGFILGKCRGEQSPESHAAQLGMTLTQYTSLAWCLAPRDGHMEDDMANVARHVGVDPGLLHRLLVSTWGNQS